MVLSMYRCILELCMAFKEPALLNYIYIYIYYSVGQSINPYTCQDSKFDTRNILYFNYSIFYTHDKNRL